MVAGCDKTSTFYIIYIIYIIILLTIVCMFFFIGPESDHWECLSVTHSLSNSRLVNLIDVTLACEEAYSKLVEVVILADDSDEDRVGNNLLKAEVWS